MISAVVAAAVVLMQATPAANADAPASAAPATASKTVSPVTVTPQVPISKRHDADPTQVVCTSETPLGSRFPVKTCATRRERGQRTQEDQAEVRRWVALRPGSGN